ncbi:hypothetical protein IAT38_002195 [Cryptococcus sp. DSM 104549]
MPSVAQTHHNTTSSPSRPQKQRHSPPTFADLQPVHKLVLAHLKRLAPHKLLSLSRELYNELLPRVYTRVSLSSATTPLFFHGFLPGPPSWNRRATNKRKRLPSFPHLPPPSLGLLLPNAQLPPSIILRDSRKFNALLYTTHLTLADPSSLSTICAAHIEVINHSPVISTALSPSRRRGSDEDHIWPLLNVQTLHVGWPLMLYLADSHSLHPSSEPVPICCIPFDVRHLVVDLGELGKVDKGNLRQAIRELAGEFQLESITLRPSEGAGEGQGGGQGRAVYIPTFDPPFPAPLIRIHLPHGAAQPKSAVVDELAWRVREYVEETVAWEEGEIPRVEFEVIHAGEVGRKARDLLIAQRDVAGLGVLDRWAFVEETSSPGRLSGVAQGEGAGA